ITETWISDNSCLSLYQIPGYSFFHLPRNFKMVGKSAGGGVGCFISNSWNSKALCSPELSGDLSASLGFLALDIFKNGDNKIIIVVYRPPDSSVSLFLQALEIIIDHYSKLTSNLFFAGDFNLNYLIHDTSRSNLKFIFDSFGLFQCITKPTYVKHLYSADTTFLRSDSSLLDHIYFNSASALFTAGILTTDISDHYATFLILHPEHPSASTASLFHFVALMREILPIFVMPCLWRNGQIFTRPMILRKFLIVFTRHYGPIMIALFLLNLENDAMFTSNVDFLPLNPLVVLLTEWCTSRQKIFTK